MVRKGRENDSGRGKRMCKGPGVREAQQEKGSKGDWYDRCTDNAGSREAWRVCNERCKQDQPTQGLVSHIKNPVITLRVTGRHSGLDVRSWLRRGEKAGFYQIRSLGK